MGTFTNEEYYDMLMALVSAMGNITLLQDDTPNCTQTQQDIHRLLLYFELLKGYTKLAVFSQTNTGRDREVVRNFMKLTMRITIYKGNTLSMQENKKKLSHKRKLASQK
ncbi:uncharacterized protein LOC105423789 isoform X2 [Pogonomyrmex barbatus]|uniref:Uncharacterized protein LOC105423789 isoform X2 n=1 Tax=Pogonomyrmex barbatus TaxID=144034 RepID=A0A6I9W108_9HYME|nr:uncharacterized protein LOC105423789 isoform X2 [Pogonomyrmex barbatus]